MGLEDFPAAHLRGRADDYYFNLYSWSLSSKGQEVGERAKNEKKKSALIKILII